MITTVSPVLLFVYVFSVAINCFATRTSTTAITIEHV